jgi:hypothetical protein
MLIIVHHRNNAKMKIFSISISVLGMLYTASSWGQATICDPCHSEELRSAAMDKVLASIGCDCFDCGKRMLMCYK